MRAISLLSSGLDSVVATASANENMDIVLALIFDYGQRAARREIEFSRRICEHFDIEYKVIELDWLAEITDTSLVNRNADIPHISEDDILSGSPETVEYSAKQVWVPNRNGAMINIAASFAESMDCEYIVSGFNGEEAETFPDNSLYFLEAVNMSLSYSTKNGVEVIAPLIDCNKTEIVKRGLEINAPFEWSWSCYHDGEKPCGVCESCIRRKMAFENAGVQDPLLLRFGTLNDQD